MHLSSRGWLGQTYALAKFDDSFDGKKTVVRRTKEERKAMVEKYIKRYQKLNNGDFPSLNLTRKEVGGSFYTVREIVREIIQENRVLGPPKSETLPADENMENVDSFLENYPLGSISVDHHVHPEDTPMLSEYEFISENVTNTQSIAEVHQESNEAFENSKNTEILVEGAIGGPKDELVADETRKHQIVDDVKVNGAVHHMDEKSSKIEVVDANLEEKDIEYSELASGNKDRLDCDDVNGSTVVKLEEPLLDEEKAVVNGTIGQNHNSATSSDSQQQQTVGERSANFDKSSDQPDGNYQNRGPNATINRINLESWKATSKKSNGREVHPLVKFIRSSIAAFVKFWSE